MQQKTLTKAKEYEKKKTFTQKEIEQQRRTEADKGTQCAKLYRLERIEVSTPKEEEPDIHPVSEKSVPKKEKTCHPSGFREVCTREREICHPSGFKGVEYPGDCAEQSVSLCIWGICRITGCYRYVDIPA